MGVLLMLLALLVFVPQRLLPGPDDRALRWGAAGAVLLTLWLATGGNQAARDLATAAGEAPP